MTEDNDGKSIISGSVPLGAIAAGALIAVAAAAAYLLANRENGGVTAPSKEKGKSGKGFGMKLGLMTVITLIENEAPRKLVIALLRAMARRA
jgi:hypothetical protein